MNGTALVQSPNIYFTNQAKLDAIAAVKRGERRMKVAHSLGITGEVLTDWLSTLANQDWMLGCHRSPINNESDTLDRAVYTWYIQQIKGDIYPTVEDVTKKANIFAMRLNKSPGHVNYNWVQSWMYRHEIHLNNNNSPKITEAEILEEEIADKKIREKKWMEMKNTPDKKVVTPTRNRKRAGDKPDSADKPRTYARNIASKVIVNGFHSKELGPFVLKKPRLNSTDGEKETTKDMVKPNEDMVKPNEETFQLDFDLKNAIDGIISQKIKPDTSPDKELYDRLSDRFGCLEVQCKFVESVFKRLTKFPALYRNSGLLAQKLSRIAELKKKTPTVKGKVIVTNQRDEERDSLVEFTKNEIIFSGQNKLERRHLPPFGAVKRAELKVGMMVYAAKGNSLSIWMLARIMETKQASVDGVMSSVYRVRFENKRNQLVRICPPKLLSYSNPPNVTLPVGSRIVARYREDTGEYHIALYAGIIAEPPKVTNNLRYLVFFDDGYAQYVRHFEVFLVCSGKKEVWEEINHSSREFIKTYLAQYPERPMVKLQRGQRINTEWNGEWWQATVNRVDASLVEMYFEADKRTEWIYRGSTRLEPLFQELARTKAINESGKPVKRHNINFKRKDRPYVEYTRFNDDDLENIRPSSPEIEVIDSADQKAAPQTARKHTGENSRQVARKSTTQGLGAEISASAGSPYFRYNHPGVIDPARAISQLGHTETFNLMETKRLSYLPHRCMNHCLGKEDLTKHRGQNPLRIPMLCGWQREITKFSVGCKRQVFYRAPCGRRFRNMEEVARFLRTTISRLTIDIFCFDVTVHTFDQFRPAKICFFMKDITYGQEPVPVCCVNSLNHENPPYVEYSSTRFTAKGVSLNLDPEFLCCCDCVDDCQNREKCQCQQLTVTATNAFYPEPKKDAGYKHRRLMEPFMTGIYECNQRCRCRASCVNRVAQNGLQVRLQMFKTEQRGWGIRCLDDIPQGMFICVYAGQLLSEQEAIEQGRTFGDEYQAELDHIEVVENCKEGYEAEVIEDTDKKDSVYIPTERYSESSDNSDSDFEPSSLVAATNGKNGQTDAVISKMSTRVRNSRSNSTQNEDTKSDSNDNDNRDIKLSSSFDIAGGAVKLNKEKALEKHKPMRMSYFNEEFCYIMDAKNKGNIGRYLNHSCSPNVFVQNVFVDTHDLRFPWVAFFASTFIRAGKELTWDYSYEIGSVKGKVMYCFCGTSECRGRLL